MSYLAKMIMEAWIGIVLTFIILKHIPAVWMQVLAVLVAIVGLVIFTGTQNPEKRAANLAEVKRFWAKPIWQRIGLGILIFSPPFAVFLFASDFVDEGTGNLGVSAAVGIVFGTWMEIVYGWIHKRKDLTAQSDETNTA